MSTNQHKPARAWAAQIIDAWIERRPTAAIFEQIPEHMRPLVRSMAESTRAAIIAHAKKPLPNYGRGLAALAAAVMRYKKART